MNNIMNYIFPVYNIYGWEILNIKYNSYIY